MPVKCGSRWRSAQHGRAQAGAGSQAVGVDHTAPPYLWRGQTGPSTSPPGLMQYLPCLHLAGSPRPGLGARTRRQEIPRGPSPPPGHDITHWNWHSLQGHLRSSCGFIPPAKIEELGTLGTGSMQGRQRAHRVHVAGTCTATVLHRTSESWATGQRREPPPPPLAGMTWWGSSLRYP